MEHAETIARLEKLAKLIRDYDRSDAREREGIRSQINREADWARSTIAKAGSWVTFTISPPPSIGGLVHRDADPFIVLFTRPYNLNPTDSIIDMIERAIGTYAAGGPRRTPEGATLISDIRPGFAFVAMAIDPQNPELDDVLDAIKEAAKRCGVEASRIDDENSNERITDRIVQSIREAEFVIVDLTNERPNVFWEAGYAHGLGKTPIYLAKQGTKIHFDVHDYPIILFRGLRDLKEALEKRLRALAEPQAPVS